MIVPRSRTSEQLNWLLDEYARAYRRHCSEILLQEDDLRMMRKRMNASWSRWWKYALRAIFTSSPNPQVEQGTRASCGTRRWSEREENRMSNETKQGVAQVAIERAESDTRKTPGIHQPSLVLGMEIMVDGLSAEARRILREDFSEKDRLYGYDSEVRQAFELLGLDLEGEDTDG